MSQKLGDGIDLILGGHDHSTELTTSCGHAPYVKADSDLKTQWVMSLFLDADGKVESVDGRLLSLTDADPFDEETHYKIIEWEDRGAKEMNKKIGCMKEDLDAVAVHVRQEETNIGNFFSDSVRVFHHTDVGLINGGAIRGNKIYSEGDLTVKIVTAMHPFGNNVVKIYATGAELATYIEKQLECYEDVCGNFVAISGLIYTFDSTANKGNRLKKLAHLDGKSVHPKENFRVAITDYQLANSELKNNIFFDMTTLNDALPILLALFDVIKKAGMSCISPQVDGRITNLGKII